MNKIYKVVWSKAKNCYVVASELAKRHTKGSGTRSLTRAAVTMGLVAGLTVGMAGSAWAADTAKVLEDTDGVEVYTAEGADATFAPISVVTDVSTLEGKTTAITYDTTTGTSIGGVVTVGTLTASDLASLNGGIAVGTGTPTFGVDAATGNTTVGGTLDVAGDTTVGTADTNANLNVNGNIAATGTLGVTGATTLSDTTIGTTDANANLSVNGNIAATGDTTVGGTLDVAGDTTVGTTDANANLSVNGNIEATGTLSAAGGEFTVNENGGVKAAGGNFTVNRFGGVQAAGGKFKVDRFGAVTAAGGNFTVDADGSTEVAGTLDVAGDTTVGGTLDVTDATTLGSTLDVAGATTLNDTLTVEGDTELKSNLKVGGEALFNEGKTNQIKIDESGIRIGLHSGQIDDEGFYAGGHTWDEAMAAMGADGRIKGTQFIVNGKTYIDKDGLNANHQKIRNLAPGDITPSSTDAINGAQIYDLSQELRRVGAGAAAMANLRPVDMGNKFSVALGVGAYRDEKAMAAGLFYRPTDRIMINMSGTIGNSNNMIGGGISFALDKVVKPVGGAANAEVKALKAENAEIKAELAELKAAIKALKEAK